METGFSLPNSEVRANFIPHAIGFIGGAAFVCFYFSSHGKGVLFITSIITFMLLVELCMYIFILRYKYVFLSEIGIKGRGKTKLQWEVIRWEDHLIAEPTTLNRLKGSILTSESSGQSIFVPEAIINLPAFQAMTEKMAPPEHLLRNLSFNDQLQQKL